MIERKGKLYLHKFRSSLNITSIANLRQSKIAKERVYVYANAIDGSLHLMKIPLIFDPKASPECVDNFVIKQQFFEKKAIKRAVLFHASNGTRYLVLSMFSNLYKNLSTQQQP